MYVQLLDHIKKEHVINPEIIADEMHWDLEETRVAIEHLIQLGRIEKIELKHASCDGNCKKCGVK